MNSLRFLCQTLPGLLATELLTLAATAQPCTLTGTIKGLEDKPIVFLYMQQGREKQDTVFAKKDQFSYQPKISDDGRIRLRVANPPSAPFWYEPGQISVIGDVAKPYGLVFSGDKEDNTETLFKQTVEWVYDVDKQHKTKAVVDSLSNEQHRATLAFIRKHPDTRTAAHLLYWEATTDQKRVAEHQQISQQLTGEVRASYYGKAATRLINNIINQPIVSRKAPDFSLPDTSGAPVSLSSFKGKYVLLDFWGHWCAPCLKSFGHLKTIQEKYADNLVLIGVAAEAADDKAKWTSAIRKHKANWLQLSELKGYEGDVNEQYNVINFPVYLLLDKDGTVLERVSELQPIEQKLASLFDR